MASIAQTVANRSNAQKSTGPRTPEGKAIVAQNAVRHGLTAQRVIVKGEDPGKFALYREGMLEDLEPMGSVEALLAERVVNLAWRLRRAERLEGAAWDVLEAQRVAKARDQPGESDIQDDEEAVLARMVVQDFGKHKLLDQLLGYERRIESSLYRTMNELRKERILRQVKAAEEELQAGVGAGPRTCPNDMGQPRQERGRPRGAAPTGSLPPGGVTTNGAEPADASGETKPNQGLRSKAEATRGHAEKVCGAHPTAETAGGVTTNGAEAEGLSCETRPICVSSSEDRGPCDAIVEEIGRGRPSYEEPPSDETQHSDLPSFQDSSSPAGPSCETKPNEATGEKSQVISQPG
jgi:hypothetical protein